MHENLVDNQTLFYVILTVIDVIGVACCIFLAHTQRDNNAIYRIGLVILSFGLIFQLMRNYFFFVKMDIPYWLSMTWGLKDIGVCICIFMAVVFRVRITHSNR